MSPTRLGDEYARSPFLKRLPSQDHRSLPSSGAYATTRSGIEQMIWSLPSILTTSGVLQDPMYWPSSFRSPVPLNGSSFSQIVSPEASLKAATNAFFLPGPELSRT